MATLQAASRSLWGSSRCRGAWALVLRTRGDSCCGSQPRASGPSLRPGSQHGAQAPAAQHVPLGRASPPPCNFLLQGDSWSRG